MSDKSNATATASVGFPVFTAATLVLLVLKLGEVGAFATISWWWVFAPMLFGFALIFFFLFVFVLFAIFVTSK